MMGESQELLFHLQILVQGVLVQGVLVLVLAQGVQILVQGVQMRVKRQIKDYKGIAQFRHLAKVKSTFHLGNLLRFAEVLITHSQQKGKIRRGVKSWENQKFQFVRHRRQRRQHLRHRRQRRQHLRHRRQRRRKRRQRLWQVLLQKLVNMQRTFRTVL
jgi:hypothetical protein